MRIISGKYKGHHLISFQADHIRPTTDRVKETLFNKLFNKVINESLFEIDDANVLDLFCGTGNLGLEALSRGARFVNFVDLSKKSLEITKKNIEKLKIPKEQYKIILKDVPGYLKQYQGEPFKLILVDPPFTKKMAHEVMLAASQSEAMGPNTVLTIESESHERLETAYGDIFLFDSREYGDKTLSFFTKKSDKNGLK
ncbi:MAG: 16S rRNA (guanine(966)-N(2))-methyltransferase RsmD [Bdellovibrionaceae bacterium]|nr:16S rRNA (guanine(966)-N(2))-methyltransferase RsmD [Pseudobdellovibrionaceae bacterium]